MQRVQHFCLAVLLTALLVNLSLEGGLECGGDSSHSHHISLSVKSIRSKGGEWVTSFLGHQNTSDGPKSIEYNVTRNFVKCQGNSIIQIGGFLKAKLDENGSAFTSRPLKDDEIFAVRIDGKDGKLNHALGIGLTQLTPYGQDLQDHYKSGTWMFYHSHLYENDTVVNADYLKTNLKDIQVGQTVGVMRSKYGTLHFYIDGVDQGPAASNIPDKVYGIFELYGNVVKGSIIDV